MTHRYVRRNLALAVGALVFAVPSVASCGFNYATDREYTPASGVSDKDSTVDVLNAVIVSKEAGSGTFLASLSNNSSAETISFQALDFGSNSTVQVATFTPIEIKPRQLVNLADGEGIKVSGDFATGDFVSLTLGFDNGETASMQVPVVQAAYEWEDKDNGTGTPASPSPSGTVSPSDAPAPSDTAAPSPSAS